MTVLVPKIKLSVKAKRAGKITEIVVLCAVVILAWGLLTIPLVVYLSQDSLTNGTEQRTLLREGNETATINTTGNTTTSEIVLGVNSGSGNIQSFENVDENDSTVNSSVVCNKEFYLDGENHVCRPKCGVWWIYPSTTSEILTILAILTSSIRLLLNIAVIVVSCARYKHM